MIYIGGDVKAEEILNFDEKVIALIPIFGKMVLKKRGWGSIAIIHL